ncbi:MAG: hypothetical protein AUK35_07725 [Zetaproteobacteria bacterium CG2_30_46_52]|nr:MAG: hypothetical protein AUK35_07725 [Zetaproteobacteria bacterium CG2_30_46_52]
MIPIGIATEDELSEAVVEKVILGVSADFDTSIKLRKGGNGYLRSNIKKFNNWAANCPVVVLTDLDAAPCPVSLLSSWLTTPKNSGLVFRVAVREVESWLLADADGISSYLKINTSIIPKNPESLENPKRELLGVVSKSKDRNLKADILPASKNSTSRVGLGYNFRLVEFVNKSWDYRRAALQSDSLRRFILNVEAVYKESSGSV